ncbi:YdcF family protein [Spirosoma sp.]|uniref:YdcF family protein n=1 Tax=Spirosoma sp. TaxID=1899569 RepID=UPI003B3AF336
MFYFFSKTVTYLLTPAGWIVGLLMFAFFTKSITRRQWLIASTLGIFWLLGNPFLMNELALWWEYPIQVDLPVPTGSSARIAVVLTGGMTNARKEVPGSKRERNARFNLGREADRAGQALYLYKSGAVQKIIVSGGIGNLPFRARDVSDEGHTVAQFLMTAGVSPTDVLLESKSLNTHENAVFSVQMLQKAFHTNRCVLVTSAWHMRRAVGCFEKEGAMVTPFPGSFLSGRRSFAVAEWLLPNEETFFNAYYLTRELVGYVTYKVVGYL